MSITKAIEKKLRTFAADDDPTSEFASLARQLVALVDDAVARRARADGVSAVEAIRTVRRVIPTAVLPPRPTPDFYRFVTRRLNFLGLDLEDVERAAERAKRTYRAPISVEYLIKTIDRLVAPGGAEDPAEEVGCGDSEHEPYTGRPRSAGIDW